MALARSGLALGAPRSWTRQLAGLAAVLMLLPVLLHGYGHLLGLAVWPLLERRHALAQAPLIVDRNGRLLGAMPASTLPGSPGDAVLGVAPAAVPPLWAELVIACEDRRLRGYLGLAGIDPVGLARALLALAQGKPRQGGSTIAIQLVRLLYGSRDPRNEPLWRRLASKPLELALAPVLRARLGTDGLLLWYATHATLATGLGNDLAGLPMAAELVFGRPLARLTDAELAVLAAASRQPIRRQALPAWPDAQARAKWESVKARARRCAAAARPGDRALQRAISSLPQPSPGQADRLHPQRRTASLGNGIFLPELMAELGEIGPAEPPLRLAVALRREEQAACERAVLAEAGRFARQHARHLQVPAGDKPQLPGELLVAVVDQQGGLRCLVGLGSQARRLFGPPAALVQGQYDPERDPFVLGSIGKLVLALGIARVDRADTLWCDAAAAAAGDRALRNAGGSTGWPTCSVPNAWVSAEDVFARSLSLPAMWRAQKLDEGRWASLVGALGLSIAPGVSPSYAIAFGLVRGRPITVLELMDALAACALGGKPAGRPHLTLAPDRRGEPEAGPTSRAVRRRCTSGAARFLRAVLAAPTAPSGTMAGTVFQPGTRGVSAHLGKTGTVEDGGGRTQAVLVAGSIAVRRTDRLTYFVRLQAGDPSRPLGHGLAGGGLVPIADAALTAILSPRS